MIFRIKTWIRNYKDSILTMYEFIELVRKRDGVSKSMLQSFFKNSDIDDLTIERIYDGEPIDNFIKNTNYLGKNRRKNVLGTMRKLRQDTEKPQAQNQIRQ